MARGLVLLSLALVVLPVTMSCGGGGASSSFHVTHSTPYDGADVVPIDLLVTVTFSGKIDPASATPTSLRLVAAGGSDVAGETTILAGPGTQLRFTPQGSLAPTTAHTIVIDSALRSVEGETVEGDLLIAFTTSGAPVAPVPLGVIRPTSNLLAVGRRSHRATVLVDERILVTGGFTQGEDVTATAEVLDPVVEHFSLLTATMGLGRAMHASVLLEDGRVLLAGGWVAGQAAGTYQATATAEVFDPATNTFSSVGPMTRARADAAALLLPNGRVLITGGSELSGGFYLDHDDAEVFDPATDTFTPLPSIMAHSRASHGMAMLGPDHVLLVGGHVSDLRPEVFRITTGLFSPLAVPAQDDQRFGVAVEGFASGHVCAAGGDTRGTVLYGRTNPLSVQNTGSALTRPRAYATATAIAPDAILVAGGVDFDSGAIHATIDLVKEELVGGSLTFATTLRFPTGLAMHAAARLPDGRILFCGGLADVYGDPNKDVAYLYDPP